MDIIVGSLSRICVAIRAGFTKTDLAPKSSLLYETLTLIYILLQLIQVEAMSIALMCFLVDITPPV
jgi:hypothetical protein